MSFDIYSYDDIKAKGWNRLAVNVYESVFFTYSEDKTNC